MVSVGIRSAAISAMTLFGLPAVAFAAAPMPASSPTPSALPPLPPGEEIYDLAAERFLAPPWVSLAVDALLMLVMLAAAWYILRRLVCLGMQQEVSVETPPPDPLEEALDRLQHVRSHLAAGILNDKDLCEQLAGILKVFAWRLRGVGYGFGSTSDELLECLRRDLFKQSLIQDIERIQNLTDAVKFARGTLGTLTPEEMIAGYENLIRRPEWNS